VPLLIVWHLRSLGLQVSPDIAGVIGLVLVFLLTASAHFLMPQALAAMLPPFVPARLPIVYLTGVLEIALALGIALPATRRLAGLAAIATLVLFFPANVYAAFTRVDIAGHAWGPTYLLIRAPLQALLIAWTWWFTVPPRFPPRRAGRRTQRSAEVRPCG
jgi:uncharacterized membrane protein